MIMFLCFYLIIGLIIALRSISGYVWDEEEKLGRYTIFTLKLFVCSTITVVWPLLIIMAININENND